MKFRKFWTVILIVLFCLNLSCTNILSDKKVTALQIQKFHNQLKNNEWNQIYDQSSSALKSRMTEQEFVILMKSFVDKMKKVDETLNFQESEIDFVLESMNIDYKYSIKLEKLEKNGDRIELITHWNKVNSRDGFKLSSLAIMSKSESGEFENFYI